jgi:hypothetical protein
VVPAGGSSDAGADGVLVESLFVTTPACCRPKSDLMFIFLLFGEIFANSGDSILKLETQQSLLSL